ncbi:ArsA-related P-loop ATPase [Blastococcus saxobsidens]|uniref:Oxyanion-translocating ATPase n=1 Tax=Blastococcus saxobsidens (strain DD2) TaxID=1146883 RepID=H6RP11_BLASD|nr:ArsA-related P-loop ATPase [Blastococcus saxobsidens]CCG01473.1 Oxyanion-translocating ATPase [Blastococcus saxobsidens DD2]
MIPDLSPARLHVVTGKGGTGKTTVAAALALALAAGGRSVLLVETEGRQGIAQLFDTPPLPYEERRVAVARGGGEVKALAIDVEEALLDYLDMFYNLRRAGRALRKMGAIDFATAIAPGLRDVLITGKIKEAVTRRRNGREVYDAVVVDAPPTGRITRFLGVTGEMSQLARSGPIKTQSDGVMAVLRSPQTAVHLVTILEDMPVQETTDAIAELEKAGLPIGSVVVNMAAEPVLPADALSRAAAGELSGADLSPALAAAGLPGGAALADALAAEVVEHARRWTAQDALRDQVTALGRPTVELPLLPGPMDVGCLFELAGRLEDHLRAEVGRADRGVSIAARNERGAERSAGASGGTA